MLAGLDEMGIPFIPYQAMRTLLKEPCSENPRYRLRERKLNTVGSTKI